MLGKPIVLQSGLRDGLANPIDERVRHYVGQALAPNSLKAYKNDLDHYRSWGGPIPASPETIAAYLTSFAGRLSISTISRRLVSLNKAHLMVGHPSPCKDELVRLTFRGIRREHGKPQKQAAPLLKDDLIVVLSKIPDDLRGKRDKALLLLGFCAALRRSELCRVRVEDLQFTSDGIIVTVPRSKTDQLGEGRKVGIPYGRGRVCPVKAIRDWIEASSLFGGWLFPSNTISGQSEPLCDRTVANIIVGRAAKASSSLTGLSGHSLRAGLATSAAQQGVSSWKIREQTGHKSEAMLERYIRSGKLFNGNAASIF